MIDANTVCHAALCMIAKKLMIIENPKVPSISKLQIILTVVETVHFK